MPRRPRFATGGYVFHVLNRSVGRQTIFHTDADYLAFLRSQAAKTIFEKYGFKFLVSPSA